MCTKSHTLQTNKVYHYYDNAIVCLDSKILTLHSNIVRLYYHLTFPTIRFASATPFVHLWMRGESTGK